MISHFPTAHINLSALQHNFNVVRQHSSANILCMLKANAYGHGLIPIAQALHEADGFGVARLEEALALRAVGITQKIVVMLGFLTHEELELFFQHNLDAVIHSEFQLDLLEAFTEILPLPLAGEGRGEGFNIWLKLDIGMHRLGFLPKDFAKVYQRLKQCKVISELMLMTHFPCADDFTNPITDVQIAEFFNITKNYSDKKSIANSAIILQHSVASRDWVRPGIMLYGASPLNYMSADNLDLKPVMTLSSRIIAIHELPAGAAIGYGSTWTCPEAMRIAVVAIGYGDGYPRHVPSGTPVLIRGKHLPLIGRVSMDLITVDLRGADEIEIGDEVILWGEGLSADLIANHADTIAYELFCRLTSRIKFIYN